MKKTLLVKILFFVYTLSFVCNLPFSILEMYNLMKEGKLITIDIIVLVASIFEFTFYISSIILFLLKSDKTIFTFNLAISFTIIYMFLNLIIKIFYHDYFHDGNLFENIGKGIGFLIFVGIIVFIAYFINKFMFKKVIVDEIDKIGERDIL